jgi:hypothetical protein
MPGSATPLALVPTKPLKPSAVISDALTQIGDRYGAIVVIVDDEIAMAQ